ncbi:unnamed protein product [Tilletia laevis]|nr:hypothetical protein CF336_g9144 [Tilletia laevis]KAE8181197.1 hypothetical protein CF328_g8916 [Tilletia controversa]CAD7067723.1 unnamed protein product [Tilletia caries]KAE8181516.1 hypothetical protein CF335_g8913 [Tilletia laevis]CAD6944008.1 unnamed protein product [Tilletia controversa]
MVFLAGLRTAVGPTFGLIFGVQAIGAAHAIVTKSERYYDLFGSVGFLTASVFSLYAPGRHRRRGSPSPRSRSTWSTRSRQPLSLRSEHATRLGSVSGSPPS